MKTLHIRVMRWLALAWAGACAAAGLAQPAAAGTVPVEPPAAAASDARPAGADISRWLMRMQEASRNRAYMGTFVVSSPSHMSSARIWHVCSGDLQMERVESLSGTPRSTFRRNDEVITFLPASKTAVSEKRESLGFFPNLLKSADSSIEQFYSAHPAGSDRVAGFDADVVVLQPKDALRFGYRVWSEKKTGLVVKMQTLDVDGSVVEQAAFSELEMDAPVSMEKLSRMMGATQGYKVEEPEFVKTTALAEGWVLKHPVAGFRPMSCYRRPMAGADASRPESTMQWIFSDGLASVSVFVEAFDKARHVHEGAMSMGATNTLTRRFREKSGDWWLTIVGEVPRNTLRAFADGLQRSR